MSNPFRPEEVAYFVPPAPRKSQVGEIQLNDVFVDERGVVYSADRLVGGLYTFELRLWRLRWRGPPGGETPHERSSVRVGSGAAAREARSR